MVNRAVEAYASYRRPPPWGGSAADEPPVRQLLASPGSGELNACDYVMTGSAETRPSSRGGFVGRSRASRRVSNHAGVAVYALVAILCLAMGASLARRPALTVAWAAHSDAHVSSRTAP
jgi:hypothetical protein